MSSLTFHTPDGLDVILTADRYRNKIFRHHPDVAVADIEEALTRSIAIYDHLTEQDARVYEGPQRGRGFFPQNFTRVVIRLIDPQHAVVKTAHLETRCYQGARRWPLP